MHKRKYVPRYVVGMSLYFVILVKEPRTPSNSKPLYRTVTLGPYCQALPWECEGFDIAT